MSRVGEFKTMVRYFYVFLLLLLLPGCLASGPSFFIFHPKNIIGSYDKSSIAQPFGGWTNIIPIKMELVKIYRIHKYNHPRIHTVSYSYSHSIYIYTNKSIPYYMHCIILYSYRYNHWIIHLIHIPQRYYVYECRRHFIVIILNCVGLLWNIIERERKRDASAVLV